VKPLSLIRFALVALLAVIVAGVLSAAPADAIVLWLLIACLPAVNLYPFFYAFRPWRTTAQGRALMVKALGNVIVIDLSMLYLWLGDYPGRNQLRIIGFTLFAVGINYLFATLLTSPGADRYPPRSWFRR
jgi:hypothetical protein